MGVSSPFKLPKHPSFSKSSRNEAMLAPTVARSTLDVRSTSSMLPSNQTGDSLTPRVSPKFHFDESLAPYCTPPQSPPPQPRRRTRNSQSDTKTGNVKEMGKHMRSTRTRDTPDLMFDHEYTCFIFDDIYKLCDLIMNAICHRCIITITIFIMISMSRFCMLRLSLVE